MQIQPADLGGAFAVEIMKARVAAANAGRRNGRIRTALTQSASAKKPERLNAVDKLLLKGSGFSNTDEKEAVAVLAPLRRSMILGAAIPMFSIVPTLTVALSQGHTTAAAMLGAITLGVGGMVSSISFLVTRQQLITPLTEDEIVNLTVAQEEGSLQQAYLRLVRNFAKQENIAPEAQEGLREALRSLGQAIERLPSVGSGAPQASAEELRRNAEAVRRRAESETDAVTQASLERQADTIEQSAQAADRSAVLIKRTQALREELFAQIESLRMGLTAFYTGDADVSGLARLSENVRTVAAEAISVSDARAELDATPRATYIPTSPSASKTEVVTLGSRK